MQGDYSVETPHKQCCWSCGSYWYSKEKIPIDADPAKTLCPACDNYYARLKKRLLEAPVRKPRFLTKG